MGALSDEMSRQIAGPKPQMSRRELRGRLRARQAAQAELPCIPCREIIGARQVRPAPLYWGLDLERVALAGPIPEPHAP